MSEIMVTAAQLRAKADELENLNGQLKTAHANLGSTEQALNGMWEGEARTTFHNAFESDRTQISNFSNAIATYVAALRNAAARYEQKEAQNAQLAGERKY